MPRSRTPERPTLGSPSDLFQPYLTTRGMSIVLTQNDGRSRARPAPPATRENLRTRRGPDKERFLPVPLSGQTAISVPCVPAVRVCERHASFFRFFRVRSHTGDRVQGGSPHRNLYALPNYGSLPGKLDCGPNQTDTDYHRALETPLQRYFTLLLYYSHPSSWASYRGTPIRLMPIVRVSRHLELPSAAAPYASRLHLASDLM